MERIETLGALIECASKDVIDVIAKLGDYTFTYNVYYRESSQFKPWHTQEIINIPGTPFPIKDEVKRAKDQYELNQKTMIIRALNEGTLFYKGITKE